MRESQLYLVYGMRSLFLGVSRILVKQNLAFPETMKYEQFIAGELFDMWLSSMRKETKWSSVPFISTPFHVPDNRKPDHSVTVFCYAEVTLYFCMNHFGGVNLESILFQANSPKGNEIIDMVRAYVINQETEGSISFLCDRKDV